MGNLHPLTGEPDGGEWQVCDERAALVDGSPAAAAHARRFARKTVADLLPADVVDRSVVVTMAESVELVISELVTNAIRASADPIGLRIEAHNAYLRVSVADTSNAKPMPRAARPMDTHGRGLAIVARLSQSWGTRPLPSGGGKTVWADFAMTLNGARLPGCQL